MIKEKISIIAQCYNEEETIKIYYDEMKKIMEKMNNVDFEIIFIDDCSKDRSLEIIKELAEKDSRIKCLSLSRNFGREASSMAGFEYATGDYITTMDIDLQDPPELLIEMYNTLKTKKFDIAAAKATTRKGYGKFHKLCIKIFYKIINKISTVQMIDGQREYRLMTRQVVNELIRYKEKNLFNKALLNDVGFRIKWIEYENIERVAGNTKFPYKRMIKYALTGIIAYSSFPLTFIIILGIILLIISIILLISMIILLCLKTLTNFSTLFLTTMLTTFTSIILISLGIMSLYLYQIHIEVKQRPLYIIRETIDHERESKNERK